MAITLAIPEAEREALRLRTGSVPDPALPPSTGRMCAAAIPSAAAQPPAQRPPGELEVGIRPVEGLFSNWAATSVKAGDTLRNAAGRRSP